jgi:hypothetical protein
MFVELTGKYSSNALFRPVFRRYVVESLASMLSVLNSVIMVFIPFSRDTEIGPYWILPNASFMTLIL